jgi:hypothetical protein
MKLTEAQYLKDLDKRLWTAADKLRSNLEAAVYKHVALGLIFLKYVSDAFNESCTLAALRDTLLPKLLSGELRVMEAEMVVEAVA